MRLKSKKNIIKLKFNTKATATTGSLYVIVIILLLFSASIVFMGGQLPRTLAPKPNPGTEVAIVTSAQEKARDNLQLLTFMGATLTPTLAPTGGPAPAGNTCLSDQFNEEPGILYASDPVLGGSVTNGGQIKIWVWEDDGNGGSVAPGTKVDTATGRITTPGDRTSADYNGYLWEPSIYLTRLTTPDQPGPYAGDKENGGQPVFLNAIKGIATYGGAGRNIIMPGNPGTNNPALPFAEDGSLQSVPIDPPVNILVGRTGNDWTFAEFIWDVDAMNIKEPGYYRAQIILHDGDTDLAKICTTIQKT